MILRGRKVRATEPLDAMPELQDEQPATVVTTPDELHWKEMKALLEKAISSLPDTMRAVYVLRDVQQLSTRETADCLGISIDAVKVTLHRARDRLKQTLLKSAAGAEVFSYDARYCDPMTDRVLRAILAARPGPGTAEG
jgi:RNA polymerase sigma-70 factor (ECF subfamily)